MIRDDYKFEETRKRKREDDSEDCELMSLEPKKRGRPLLLGQNMDRKVQAYHQESERRWWSYLISDCNGCSQGLITEMQSWHACRSWWSN